MNKKEIRINILVSDTTLRDGEQQVGINFSMSEKEKLAREIAKAGIHQIDVMPITSKHEEQLAKRLLKSDIKEKIFCSVMLNREFIAGAISLGARNIYLFTPLSKRLLAIENETESSNLKKAIEVCEYARKKGLRIIFAGEDASRTNLKYMLKFIKMTTKYIDGFFIADTVGVLTPAKTKIMVSYLVKKTKVPIGAHFHNDGGMAIENTIMAIKSGAKMISGTFGGIGERAGNADLCELLIRLKKEGIIIKGIDYSKLTKIKTEVYDLGGSKPAKPYTSRAFWHESGIHVHALMKDPLSYNNSLPENYGKRNRIFFGKFSGVSNYRYLFGEKYPLAKLIKIRDKIKELSYKHKRSYSEKEVKQFIKKWAGTKF